jgi:hypothetical protein
MNAVFQEEFPPLARRYRACAEALGVEPLYGHFLILFKFCQS